MATKTEIEAILANEESLNKLVKAAFDAVDTDGSGNLDIDELHVILNQVANDAS
jgi:Ca2+-binding EF-hand superfamily protein